MVKSLVISHPFVAKIVFIGRDEGVGVFRFAPGAVKFETDAGGQAEQKIKARTI